MAYYHLGRTDRNNTPYEISMRIPDIIPSTVSWLLLETILRITFVMRCKAL